MPRAHKRKNYFTVPNSIWQDDLTIEERGIIVGLVGYMCERWATDKLSSEEGTRVVLRPGVLAEITGKRTWKAGREALESALAETSAVVSIEGRLLGGAAAAPGRRKHGSRAAQDRRNVVVEWPKVATLQRFDRLAAPQSSSASASASASAKRESKAPRTPSTKAAKKAPQGKVDCPVEWSPEIVARVLEATGADAEAFDPAVARVRQWSEEQGVRRTRRGWEATIRRAITERWADSAQRSTGNGAAAKKDPQWVLDLLEEQKREQEESNHDDATP